LQLVLRAAAAAGTIPDQGLDERAHLILAAVQEGALLVAHSTTPKKTRTVVTQLLDRQLDALRSS
jgi:hypothetical protein